MSVTLSVIIPVYNGASFIAETVRSALSQTYKGYEVIIVNDGSTDATLSELAQFGNAIIVISIPNGGVSNARNVGILASIGEFVAFLDADDLWHPDKLKQQVTTMKANPGVGFCCCNFTVLNSLTGVKVRQFDQFRGDLEIIMDFPMVDSALKTLIIKGNFVGTASNVVVRRDVLDRSGLFDTRFRQAEDLDLFIRCALHTNFFIISKVLLEKTTHETNLTNNLVETLQFHELVLVTLLESQVIKSREYLIPAVFKGLADVRYNIGNQFFYRGKISQCFGYFMAGLKSEWSPKNFYNFSCHSCRKLGRLLLETLRLREPRNKY